MNDDEQARWDAFAAQARTRRRQERVAGVFAAAAVLMVSVLAVLGFAVLVRVLWGAL